MDPELTVMQSKIIRLCHYCYELGVKHEASDHVGEGTAIGYPFSRDELTEMFLKELHKKEN